MNTHILLSTKTAARFAELEQALETVPGDGPAEALLDGILQSILEGDTEQILGGTIWTDESAAEATVRKLASKWKTEDNILNRLKN